MGLPKKTSRPIRVDETDYRWAESVTPLDGNSCQINVTIESQVGTTKRIYANCVCKMDWSGDREKLTLPKNVAAVIQHALENGWDPVSATEDFRLSSFDAIAGKMDHPYYAPDSHPEKDKAT
jgi:hypothetical protein